MIILSWQKVPVKLKYKMCAILLLLTCARWWSVSTSFEDHSEHYRQVRNYWCLFHRLFVHTRNIPHLAKVRSIFFWYYVTLQKIRYIELFTPESFQVQLFTARRVGPMHSADYAVARCLSVRLSHAGILSKRLNVSSKFFFTVGSQTILVFPYQTGWQYSDGDPRNGDVIYKDVWKNHDFRPMSRFISEIMQDRTTVTMEGERQNCT